MVLKVKSPFTLIHITSKASREAPAPCMSACRFTNNNKQVFERTLAL